MRRFALLLAGVALLPLAGCVLPKDEPALAGRSAYWYRHTDPTAFFAHEQARGRVYFLGVFDPARGQDSPAPGISRHDPAFRLARTWFVPTGQFLNPERARAYDDAVRRFAERYNPLVLDRLHAYPRAGAKEGPGVD